MRVRTVRAEGYKCGFWVPANKFYKTCSTTFLNSGTYTTYAISVSIDPNTRECVSSGSNPYCGVSGTEYSDEDTDDALRDRVDGWLEPIGSAPIFESQSQYSVISANEFSSGYIRKIHSQYSIIHAPTITCYLKVWLQKRTELSDTYPYTTTYDNNFAVYEWIGTGNPCIADPTKSPIPVPGTGLLSWGNPNLVTQAWQDLPIPPENTKTEFVKILKYSCVPGYEPDISDEDNPQPNGFPDPTWELAAP